MKTTETDSAKIWSKKHPIGTQMRYKGGRTVRTVASPAFWPPGDILVHFTDGSAARIGDIERMPNH